MNLRTNDDGVEICRKGFERLKSGNPLLPQHKYLPKNKITPGIVSVESGFDRGYLKSSRPHHRVLIDEINEYRQTHKNTPTQTTALLADASKQVEATKDQNKLLIYQLQQVVAQNLQLVERVRSLESELFNLKSNPKLSYIRGVSTNEQ